MKRYDHTGQRFGRMVVIESLPSRKTPNGSSKTYWRCQCDCGSVTEAEGQNLRKGRVQSCGCLSSDASRARAVELTGQRFGQLTVLGRGPNVPSGGTTWICACDCGSRPKPVATIALRQAGQVSCGCVRDLTSAMRRWTGDDASYGAVHDRLRATRGPAKTQKCIDCGEVARDWSYVGNCPNERRQFVNGYLLAYSVNPDRYAPRCAPCHRRHDLAARRDIS